MGDTVSSQPLSDVTVVDLTQAVAGPYGSMTLADLGAEVIKIERPDMGDRMRGTPPSPEYFDTVNRNKKSVGIDLKSPGGQEAMKRLLEDADVFLENTKPGRTEKFGIGYEEVREINPNIIYCTIKGFGNGSPYEGTPAYGEIIQGVSGIMSMTGEPDGPPTWTGLVIGDLGASMYAVQSILAALRARETGKIEGDWIEISMLDVAKSLLCVRAGYTFGTGEPFPRSGARHPNWAPFDAFDCRDNAIMVGTSSEGQWQSLCHAIDRPDLIEEDRFAKRSGRLDNRDELSELLTSIFETKPASEWVEILREHEVPSGPIRDTKTVWEDAHEDARPLRRTMERDGKKDATVIDHPVHFEEMETGQGGDAIRSPPPELGQDTDEVLKESGYTQSEIDALREEGNVG